MNISPSQKNKLNPGSPKLNSGQKHKTAQNPNSGQKHMYVIEPDADGPNSFYESVYHALLDTEMLEETSVENFNKAMRDQIITELATQTYNKIYSDLAYKISRYITSKHLDSKIPDSAISKITDNEIKQISDGTSEPVWLIRAYILAKNQNGNKPDSFESIVKYTIKTSQCLLPPSTIEFTIMQYIHNIILKVVTSKKKIIYDGNPYRPKTSFFEISIAKDLDTGIYYYLSSTQAINGGIKMHKKTRRHIQSARHKKSARQATTRRHKKTVKRRQRTKRKYT